MQVGIAHLLHVVRTGSGRTVDGDIVLEGVLEIDVSDYVLYKDFPFGKDHDPCSRVAKMGVDTEPFVHLQTIGNGVVNLNCIAQLFVDGSFFHNFPELSGGCGQPDITFPYQNQSVGIRLLIHHPADGILHLGADRRGRKNHRGVYSQFLRLGIHRRNQELAFREIWQRHQDVASADRTYYYVRVVEY